MKRIVLVLVLGVFCVSLFAGIGGDPALQGKITSIDKKDKLCLATVRINASSSITKEPSQKAKPGMSVKIIYEIETSQFRLPIGRVIEVRENGDVIVAVDESLLAKEVKGPNSDNPVKVSELFFVGAEVSVSGEAL